MNSPLLDKSLNFATKIVLFYEDFFKSKKGYHDCKTITSFCYKRKLMDYAFEELLSLAE